MPDGKKVVQVTLAPDVLEPLQKIAALQDRTLTGLIQHLCGRCAREFVGTQDPRADAAVENTVKLAS